MELIQQELYRRFTNDPNAIKFAASSGDSGSRSVATRSLPALIDFGDAPSVSIPAAPSISKQPSVATPTLNWWDAPNDIGAEFDGKFQSLSAAPSLRGSMTSTTSSVAPPPLPSRTNAAFLAPTAPASESHSTNISAAGTPSIPHKPAFLVTTSAVPAPFTSTNVVDNARALPPPRLPPRETSPAGIFPIPPLQQQQPSSSGFILAPPHSQQQTLSSRSTPAPPLPQAKRCPPVPIMSASPSNLPAYTDPNAHGGPQHRP